MTLGKRYTSAHNDALFRLSPLSVLPRLAIAFAAYEAPAPCTQDVRAGSALCQLLLTSCPAPHQSSRPLSSVSVSVFVGGAASSEASSWVCELMGAPRDGAEVDALLDHLPERRHLAQPLDVLHAHLHRIVDLGVSRESADAEADRRVRHVLLDSEGAEDVRRLEGGRGARRARRDGDVLERHQQRLAFHVRKRDVEVSRVARIHRAIHFDVWDRVDNAVMQALGEASDVREVTLHLAPRDLARRAKPRHQRVRQRPRTEAALLAAPREDRLEAHTRPAAHIECADALWAVELVGGDGHEVDAELLHVHRDLSHRLRRVDVQEDLSRAAEPADLGDRLYHANLVVDVHDRDEGGLGSDSGLELGQVH
eukprot:CAMPEP_0115840386 /NCGR_PEP_ID=MMETSP0287-20121206/6743_1 /TAXON_ID=412157 /ORGANISM="Chrysochromulina rotalis, Strain UIO044" /LENGTH=366 /DNA_ID=CAMNT_0003293993 /DNA_START=134 /DNA_END=1235 /DNA_ORIENTATION=+